MARSSWPRCELKWMTKPKSRLNLEKTHIEIAMKPQHQVPPFLDEAGVIVTSTHLSVPGQAFELRKLVFVRIEWVSPNLITSLFSDKRPTFRLMISTSADTAPVSVYETKD